METSQLSGPTARDPRIFIDAATQRSSPPTVHPSRLTRTTGSRGTLWSLRQKPERPCAGRSSAIRPGTLRGVGREPAPSAASALSRAGVHRPDPGQLGCGHQLVCPVRTPPAVNDTRARDERNQSPIPYLRVLHCWYSVGELIMPNVMDTGQRRERHLRGNYATAASRVVWCYVAAGSETAPLEDLMGSR